MGHNVQVGISCQLMTDWQSECEKIMEYRVSDCNEYVNLDTECRKNLWMSECFARMMLLGLCSSLEADSLLCGLGWNSLRKYT